jgi:hypothetical protein
VRKITGIAVVVALGLSFALAGCGSKPKPPISGADLVATAVAAHYVITIDDVSEEGDVYKWTISARNGSSYPWMGTLYIRLVDDNNEIIESHDFEIAEMVPPNGNTSGLTFESKYLPMQMGGEVAALKAEVDVVKYEEEGGAEG